MKRLLLWSGLVAAIFASNTLASECPAKSLSTSQQSETREEQKLRREARISKEQAQETALKRAPGEVESGGLEREHGKLVYSFDIRNTRGTITEMQVSAISGKIVRVEHESKKQEARENKSRSRNRNGNCKSCRGSLRNGAWAHKASDVGTCQERCGAASLFWQNLALQC